MIEVVVVDNDASESARATVDAEIAKEFPFPLRYFCEPLSGVSHARNRCVTEAYGGWIAFLDDDEYAEAEWLVELWNCARHERADGVFGPVLAEFEQPPPAWLLASGAHQRPRYPSGTPMKWGDCRSGNVVFRRALFSENGGFDPRFSASGGEDSDFFWRCQQAGACLVWCDSARVHESVPAQRMSRMWLLRRAYNGGHNFARLRAMHRGRWSYGVDAVWGMINIAIYMPLALAARMLLQEKAFSYERKVAGGLGKAMGWMVRIRGEYAVG